MEGSFDPTIWGLWSLIGPCGGSAEIRMSCSRSREHIDLYDTEPYVTQAVEATAEFLSAYLRVGG